MKASRVTVSTFGVILGIAGVEHGVGEIAQGNRAPEDIFIQSWPDNALYEILEGEPAMTIVPNLLITGFLAILISVLLIGWSVVFIENKHGGTIFLLLSFVMMLVGGGLAGPVLMGIILGLTATRINTEFNWLKQRHSLRGALSNMWLYVYIVSVVSWLSLWPGLVILGVFVPVTEPVIVIILTLISFISMLLAILSSFAYDSSKMENQELAG